MDRVESHEQSAQQACSVPCDLPNQAICGQDRKNACDCIQGANRRKSDFESEELYKSIVRGNPKRGYALPIEADIMQRRSLQIGPQAVLMNTKVAKVRQGSVTGCLGEGRIWWRRRDLNPRHADYDSAALTN